MKQSRLSFLISERSERLHFSSAKRLHSPARGGFIKKARRSVLFYLVGSQTTDARTRLRGSLVQSGESLRDERKPKAQRESVFATAKKSRKIKNTLSRAFYLVGSQGLEPGTNRLWAGCSNQLS